MYKLIYIFLLFFLATTTSLAQQDRYAWKIGLHGGLSNYYGDLSHQIWDLPHQFKQPIKDLNFLSYGLSVEYHVSRSFGLRLLGMKSQFKASDRTYSNNDTYDRALNVQTDLFDASLLGIVYFDNDMVLNSRAVIAPYFMFGGGLTHFETKGDLLSSNNNRYYYWSDNSIRTEDENGANAINAQMIELDHSYETNLRSLRTEGIRYTPITWNVALGLGIKFRLSSRFSLNLEALIRYTGSDYLDDVRGDYRASYNDNFQAYAANPSSINRNTRGSSPEMNDWYTFVGLSVHYSFGQKTYAIRPSIIYTENLGSNFSTSVNTTTNNHVPTTNNVPSSSNQSDTTVQKIITTTTTIKTTTVDTLNKSSSFVSPKIKTNTLERTPVINNPIPKTIVKRILEDSIEEVRPPIVPENDAIDSSRLPVDSLVQNNLPQEAIDSLLRDSISERVNTPYVNTDLDATRLPVDTLTQNRISKPVVTTLVNNKVQPILPKDSILIVNNLNNLSKNTSTDSEKIRLLELQQQEQKYQYELLLQKEKYERQLTELNLQKELKKAQQKTAPNTKEQELEFQLKLEQQKHTNELEKQRLLNQLEVEKNRPSPNTSQKTVELQQQKYEAALKLQQQEYEYKLKIQELQNQLNLEQLKKVERETGINTPREPSNTVIRELNEIKDLVTSSENSTVDTTIINNNIYSGSNRETALNISLQAMQAEKKAFLDEREALLAKVKALEEQLVTSNDTIRIVQKDSIFFDNADSSEGAALLNQQQNLNNSLVTKLAVANQKSVEQQRKIDSLQRTIEKVESEKKNITSELDVFLSQKKGTYVTKIYFDIGKSSLTAQAKETLTTLVYYLEKYPNVKFWVKGFASKTGRTEINERLSAERAAEVADFLKKSDIEGGRIRTTPLGELDSSSPNNELDRRAEVHLSF